MAVKLTQTGVQFPDLTTQGSRGLERTNNLSDLTNASVARDNLGLGSSDNVGFGNISGGAITSSSVSTGSLTATSITETSTIALKENVTFLGDNTLDRLSKLEAVTYDRIDSDVRGEPGLIAEQVFEHIPELVSLKDGKPYGVQYSKLTVYLLEAVKSLSQEIERLKRDGNS